MSKSKEPDLKEVLAAFLQVKPEPKKEAKKATNKRGISKKKKTT